MIGKVTFTVEITMTGPISNPDEEMPDLELREMLTEALENQPEVEDYKIVSAVVED